MKTRKPGGFICLCLAVLLAMLIGGSSPAAASKICIDAGSCHECDWFDANGDLISSIYWCTYN